MEIKTEVKIIEFIEYDGIRFYHDKKGYWLSSKMGTDKGPKRLHIYVWEKYHGEIPKGYHIHHIDHNTDNNEIENLTMMPEKEHLSMHSKIESEKAEAKRKFELYTRPKAAEWHKSDKSTKWHKEHYKNYLGKLHEQRITKVCKCCGKEFEVDACKTDAKYCSNKCKSKARLLSGVDNEERICEVCGKHFTVNRYYKKRTCSKECAKALNNKEAVV